MTETEFKVEIDEATGLPVVPEGFFWRVADSADWGDPEVQLIKREMKQVRKRRTFLGLDLGLGFKYVEEMGDVRESSRGFEGYAKNIESVPEDTTLVSETRTGSGLGYRYTEPVNEKTIATRAIDIMKARHRDEEADRERERRQAEQQAIKDKFYGDYPPKTLGA